MFLAVHRFHYALVDYTMVEDFLLAQGFGSILASDSVDSIWSDFKALFQAASVQFVPSTSRRKRDHPCWFNSEVEHLLNCVHTVPLSRNRA